MSLALKTLAKVISEMGLMRKYRRYQAKKTPSLMAGLVFLGGGAAFIGNVTIDGYSPTLFGLWLMLAAVWIRDPLKELGFISVTEVPREDAKIVKKEWELVE